MGVDLSAAVEPDDDGEEEEKEEEKGAEEVDAEGEELKEEEKVEDKKEETKEGETKEEETKKEEKEDEVEVRIPTPPHRINLWPTHLTLSLPCFSVQMKQKKSQKHEVCSATM